MVPLTITPNIERDPWVDCRDLAVIGLIARIGRLPAGTTSGKSVVSVLIEMPNGQRVLAQTTLALLVTAVSTLLAVDSQERN